MINVRNLNILSARSAEKGSSYLKIKINSKNMRRMVFSKLLV